jgi:hypothetical protein
MLMKSFKCLINITNSEGQGVAAATVSIH